LGDRKTKVVTFLQEGAVFVKIMTIIGARPQFIKAAVVSRAIDKAIKSIREVIVHTGQHFDENMSNIFFEEMRIPKPSYNLGVKGGNHGSMTGRMLERIEEVMLKEKPDVVLVYGDTNSTLAGALAAAKLSIPIAHVEAGLRSYNLRMPEEINRVLTDKISKWLFCPSESSINNLIKEGICSGNHIVKHVGDVMYDAILFYKEIVKPSEKISCLVKNLGNFYLATVHRAENADSQLSLSNIIGALETIAEHTHVIFPIHPRTRKSLIEFGIKTKYIHMIDPVGYFDMLALLSMCKGVFTDSGGLQKESYFLHKPCAILRSETEWVELVEHGYSILVGNNISNILSAENAFSDFDNIYFNCIYGDGTAGDKIIAEILAL